MLNSIHQAPTGKLNVISRRFVLNMLLSDKLQKQAAERPRNVSPRWDVFFFSSTHFIISSAHCFLARGLSDGKKGFWLAVSKTNRVPFWIRAPLPAMSHERIKTEAFTCRQKLIERRSLWITSRRLFTGVQIKLLGVKPEHKKRKRRN